MPRKRRAARAYRASSDIRKAVQQIFQNPWAWVDPQNLLKRVAREAQATAEDVLAAYTAEFPDREIPKTSSRPIITPATNSNVLPMPEAR